MVMRFMKELLSLDEIRNLGEYADQGIKVSTHTFDVLKLSLEDMKWEYKTFSEAKKRVEFFALTVGITIHDVSKGTIRSTDSEYSHSQIMMKKPEFVQEETEKILDKLEKKLGVRIKKHIRDNIIHIVLSHHGQWGKVQPNTKEAYIVHRADMTSAKYHRINPIGADKILKLLVEGKSEAEIAEELGCTPGIIRNRLSRAKGQLKFRTTSQLIAYYKEHKNVPIGDKVFIQRVKETDKLKKTVDETGFETLMIENPLLAYMVDKEIFEKPEQESKEESIEA